MLIYNRKFLGNNKEQELHACHFSKLCLVDSFGEEDLAQEKLAHKIIDIIKIKIAITEVLNLMERKLHAKYYRN